MRQCAVIMDDDISIDGLAAGYVVSQEGTHKTLPCMSVCSFSKAHHTLGKSQRNFAATAVPIALKITSVFPSLQILFFFV